MVATAQALYPAPAQQWVVDERARLLLDIMMMVAIMFTIVPEAFSFAELDRPNQFSGTDLGFVARVQWFPLFGIGAAIIVMRARLAWALLKEVNPFLILIMIWIFLSTFWSYQPDITLRRAVKITGMMLVAYCYFLVNWEPSAILRNLRRICYWLCAGSIIFVIVKPEYAVHQGIAEPNLKGAWRGLTNHKNALGILTAVSMSLWVHAWASRDVQARHCVLPLISVFICLLGSKSTTALVSSFATSAAVVYFLRAPARLRTPFFFIAAALAFVMLTCVLFIFTGALSLGDALAVVAGSLGKDATLTGRDAIWGAVWTEIGRHPWIGCGFNGYWVIGEPWGPSGDVLRSIGFAPLQAHNGYLDILNELGIIGFTLLLLMLGYQFWQISVVNKFDRVTASYGFAYLIYDLILNITESNFLRPTFLPCLVEYIVIIACARTLLQQKLLQQYGQTADESLFQPKTRLST